jgi:hypothetical protein
MAWVGDFEDHRVDHRQIRADRDAVVEEAGVLQAAVLAVDILLVQRPADALDGAALELAFDVGGMHRLAGILDDRVAHDLRGAGFGIDLDIADMRGEADARTIGRIFVMAGDRTAGARRGRAISFSESGSKLPALAPAGLAWPFSQVTASSGMPQVAAARAHSFLIASRAARMQAMPVAKVVRLPSVTSLWPRRTGVGDDRPHLVVGDAQFLGRHHAHRGAASRRYPACPPTP